MGQRAGAGAHPRRGQLYRFTARTQHDEAIYHEFTVSSVSLSELDTTQQIAIPQQLLEQAGIDSNAEVQIACMDGAIIITGDTPLTEDELSEVVDRLRAVNDLTKHFPGELDTEEGGIGYSVIPYT